MTGLYRKGLWLETHEYVYHSNIVLIGSAVHLNYGLSLSSLVVLDITMSTKSEVVESRYKPKFGLQSRKIGLLAE